MSCLKRIGNISEGSDKSFSIRPKKKDGIYPDISDMTAELIAKYNGSELFTCSIGSPSPNGSSVSLETDATSQYINFYISPLETADLQNNTDLEVFTTLVSAEYGTRTEAKGSYRICEAG